MPARQPDIKERQFQNSYDDALGPAFALGLGAQAPTATAFISPIRLLTFNQGTEDNIDITVQFPHTLELDVSTLTFSPHVHFTCVASPGANEQLKWDLIYSYAKPGLSVSSATAFYPIQSLTSDVRTLTGNEYRHHLIDELPDISLPARLCAPSMIFACNLRMNGASTVADATVGLLSFDVHFLKGPNGTVTEYV